MTQLASHATRHPARHRATRLAALALPLTLLLGAASPRPALGQATAAAAATAAQPATDPALLAAFGERAGIQRLAERLADKLMADPRTQDFFKNTKAKHFKQQLSDQFCQVLGAGCVYDGETMKNSHADFAISRSDFNTVVELLQDSMDEQGVPFAAQNQLLARLAPLHREIITR